MEFYKSRQQAFQELSAAYGRKYNTIGTARFAVAAVFLVLGYYAFTTKDILYLILGMAVCCVIFFVLMHYHTKVVQKKKRAEALLLVNNEELDYLSGKNIPFEDGAEFHDATHAYSHDLDIFGKRSLFQNLNRTQTYKGKERLASMLLESAGQSEILKRQEAVKELAALPEWRQEIMALGKINKDSAPIYSRLTGWANQEGVSFSGMAKILSIASPIALLLCLIVYLVTGNGLYSDVAGYLFGWNLVFLLGYLKVIKRETADTTEIHNIIEGYGRIIKEIENYSFTSGKLMDLQAVLTGGQQKAGDSIIRLSVLFARLDSIANVPGAILFNGLLLFHFHTLRSVLDWKKRHAQDIVKWLDSVAEIEALSSLANLAYNNPGFNFPQLNDSYTIRFKNLFHPLIKAEGRIGNDVDFGKNYMILTGSNMSGKSTFLRSLGINMVLAGAGAPVCASEADIHPLPVLVSMRLSDSLSDSESYFFAEVKRLRYIMDKLQEGRAFVLLDEILRGTNSEDKRTGSLKVIEKMLALKAIGAIATHDIEVCNIASQYPGNVSNHCFESQIVDGELYFDYRLREGICKNKSATFLMEKMGVIDSR
ncbi:DNA mismatch repair protein [Flavobacterium album]|uniref:DNA mismatch repair protein n=1 Tax=Flavobacterium album TaxID=2175091 RepID=A0A2S1R359_9FLAO|nr:DNA mismatch repair protein [Flavobacterium album]